MTIESATKETFVNGDSGRHTPLAMDAATFRKLGHRLVDQLAGFLESLPLGPVTRDESPSVVRDALGLTGALPEMGTDPGPLTRYSTDTRVSSDTSPHRRRRSEFSVTFSPRR
jgi:hypothetical protein